MPFVRDDDGLTLFLFKDKDRPRAKRYPRVSVPDERTFRARAAATLEFAASRRAIAVSWSPHPAKGIAIKVAKNLVNRVALLRSNFNPLP